MSAPPPPPPPSLSTPAVLGFYAATAGLALAIAMLAGSDLAALWRAPQAWGGLGPWWSGVGAGVALVALSWLAEAKWHAMRELGATLAALLGPVRPLQALLWGIASGVAEELLFRGVLQPLLGYLATSVGFALLHGGLSRRLLPWSTFALLAGLTFGLLAEAHQSWWPAAVAHVVVNAINLRRLGQRAAATEPL